MTETIPKPKNIAEAIRDSRGPTGDMVELSAQAQSLSRSLAVAEKWMEAAVAPSGAPGELFSHAEYTRDKLEEELSRVCFEMEVLADRRLDRHIKDEHPDFEGATEAQGRAVVLSNTLLKAYCALREAPE